MPTVKGSKQVKMVVVPYRPLRTIVLSLSLVLVAAVVVTASYYAGRYLGTNENSAIRIERDRLLISLEEVNHQLAQFERQRLNIEQASTVDRQALEDVQNMLVSLREKNAQLEEDVLFYRQIMSPENEETGLVIGQIGLRSLGDERRVGYRIELRQQANNDNLVSGYTNINILGRQNQQDVSMPLYSLSQSEEQPDIRLQFRYFQNIEGEMLIPEDFEPERVQIIAVNQGANAKTVEKSFSWLLE